MLWRTTRLSTLLAGMGALHIALLAACTAPIAGMSEDDKAVDPDLLSCSVRVVDSTRSGRFLLRSGWIGWENETANSRVLRNVLGELGYQISSLTTGEEHLEATEVQEDFIVEITQGCEGLGVQLTYRGNQASEPLLVDRWTNNPRLSCESAMTYVDSLNGRDAFYPPRQVYEGYDRGYDHPSLSEVLVPCADVASAIDSAQVLIEIDAAVERIQDSTFLGAAESEHDFIHVDRSPFGVTKEGLLQGLLSLEQAIALNNEIDPLSGEGITRWDHRAEVIVISTSWWRGEDHGDLSRERVYKLRFDATPDEMLHHLIRMTDGTQPSHLDRAE